MLVSRQNHHCLGHIWARIHSLNFDGCLIISFFPTWLVLKTSFFFQGVVTNILAVLTPATEIKVRSSSQAVKLETIKRSRCLFTLFDQGVTSDSTHTPPTSCWRSRVKALSTVRSSDQGPKMGPINIDSGRGCQYSGYTNNHPLWHYIWHFILLHPQFGIAVYTVWSTRTASNNSKNNNIYIHKTGRERERGNTQHMLVSCTRTRAPMYVHARPAGAPPRVAPRD